MLEHTQQILNMYQVAEQHTDELKALIYKLETSINELIKTVEQTNIKLDNIPLIELEINDLPDYSVDHVNECYVNPKYDFYQEEQIEFEYDDLKKGLL